MTRSIDDYGGVWDYLEFTRPLHNGLGATDLAPLYEQNEGNISKLEKLYGVGRPTMYNWLRKLQIIPPQGSGRREKPKATEGTPDTAKGDWL